MTTTVPRGSIMQEFDISPRGPVRVGVGAPPDGAVRVRGVDLRTVAHRVAAVRSDDPDAVVVVDIDVMIADDAHTARATLACLGREPGDTLLYVGTPTGLAGLIADIHALGIADGAVLFPMVEGLRALIEGAVLRELATMTVAAATSHHLAQTDISA